jgi:SAM-dependent methyltransferase
MHGLDADLAAYYDEEAARGLRTGHGPLRTELRERFADLLREEGRRRLIDVGAGPGLDTGGFAAEGLDAVGVDLSVENAGAMRRRGVTGVAASLYALPFRDAEFEALWTMSTFVHVPYDRFDDAMGEMCRVVGPGRPVGIGTWGGFDWEGLSDRDTIEPRRFFSLASHDRWRTSLERYGAVEFFGTWHPNADTHWEYQFAILRP